MVSVCNDSNQLVEVAQHCASLAIGVNETTIFWLAVCPLQIPLENIGEGAFAIIEVRSSLSAGGTVLLWQSLKLDKNSIDTKFFSLSLVPPPVVVSSAPGPVTNKTFESLLDIEMMITRRTGTESLVNMG